MRALIEHLTSLFAWLRRAAGLRIRPDGAQPLKLNLGAGLAVHPGWVNIDGSLNAMIAAWPRGLHAIAYRLSGANQHYSFYEYHRLLSGHRFFHADLAHGIPADDGTVEVIYSSHFLEHLYPHDAKKLLAECHRVLQVGGILRICVPDLEHACRLIAEGRKNEALATYFFVEDRGSSFARHKYMYDFALLRELLTGTGFSQVERKLFQEGATPDVRFLDNRPDDTLFVEAVK